MSPGSDGAGGRRGDAALLVAKRELRAQVLAARDALAAPVRAAAAAAIARAIVALPSFAAARTVLVTLPFGSEWDTLPIVRAALAAGKAVVVPRVDRARRMLELRAIRDPVADVVRSDRDIPEPSLSAPIVPPGTVDWVLVPGVAFDRRGRRLGYGGGFYDRLLPLLPPGTPRIAGGYDLQVVGEVPTGPHDLGVDAIVTESLFVAVDRE